MTGAKLLEVRALTVSAHRGHRRALVVKDVDLDLAAGQVLGLVGESGSGKTTVLRAVLGLLPPGLRLDSGSVQVEGTELVGLKERQLRKVRGQHVGAVWQDPLAALDPVMRVGDQVAEAVRAHRRTSPAAALQQAKALMKLVDLPDIERTSRAYPHELSGGQRQRVVIATAIAGEPRLLLADEPTTALDVTVQDQVLSLLEDLRARLGLALLLVTHDLAIVHQVCELVAVMYAGRIVEKGPVRDVFASPRHPYTEALLGASPSIELPGVLPGGIPGSAASEVALSGCAFVPRCPRAGSACRSGAPRLEGADGHAVACHCPVEAPRAVAAADAREVRHA
jgi:oligopeptide/dipeptide ABC transporter ATP-binding protein